MLSERRTSLMVLLFLLADVLCARLAGGGDGGLVPGISLGAIPGATVVHCPFNFQQGMPPGVFCVYEGVARGSEGEPCGDRVIVIWTRLAAEFDTDSRVDEDVTDPSAVYFGFVTSPDLVMRAAVDDGAESRGMIIDYTLGDDQPPLRLRGTAEMRFVPAAGSKGPDVLGLHIGGPVLAPGICAFTSFDGTFAGVMTLPPDAPW